MFNDVTIGQYYPTDSIIHKLDPRTKLACTFIYIIVLFLIDNFVGYALAFAFLLVTMLLSKVPIGYIIKGIKGLALIIIFTVILNMMMTPGTAIFQYGIFKITAEGVEFAFFMAIRLLFLVTGTNIMTLTTSPIDLTDGMEYSLKWIPFLKNYAHELAMMMSIALRFIPTLMEETDRIMKAQKARGANFETGNLVERTKALIPILVPLFISAFRRADELATAMEARCYHGGDNRTRMYVLQYKKQDTTAYAVVFLFSIGLLATRFLAVPSIVTLLLR